MKTTGEKIREGRANLGITQTELAEKIGVTLRTISKYEKQGELLAGTLLVGKISLGDCLEEEFLIFLRYIATGEEGSGLSQ